MNRVFPLSFLILLTFVSICGQALRTAPTVGEEFRVEVSQLATTGLRLKEALETSLDGAIHHLAAVFQRDKPKAPKEAFELRILE
ncbi:MAG TPA: hypothetical protein VGL29_16850, partial [Blastocatellia bacterium]